MLNHTERLGIAPLPSLLLHLSLPSIAATVTGSLYNVVDTFWVGRISHEAIAALTIVFPYQILAVALGVGTGAGISALVSRRFGENNVEATNHTAGQVFFLSAFWGALLVLIAVFCAEPILTALATSLMQHRADIGWILHRRQEGRPRHHLTVPDMLEREQHHSSPQQLIQPAQLPTPRYPSLGRSGLSGARLLLLHRLLDHGGHDSFTHGYEETRHAHASLFTPPADGTPQDRQSHIQRIRQWGTRPRRQTRPVASASGRTRIKVRAWYALRRALSMGF